MFYRSKHVLVTGGTGTIGVPVVRRLLRQGAEVTVASLDPPDRARSLFDREVRFEQVDLTDFAACLRIARGQEHVFHLAGIKGSVGIGVSRVATDYVRALWLNTNMMEAAFRAGTTRYLFVSSICAYPPAEIHDEANLWNGLPQQNDRYVGIVKRTGEIQGETYLRQHGWDAVRIVRPSNVYGPYDDFDPATAQVIPALIARMLGGENPLTVWGSGDAVRDFIYSEDVADGMLLAVERLPACTPVNLGSGQGCTIREVVETIIQFAPAPITIRWDPSSPSGDAIRVLSTKRAEDLLGFTASTPLAVGIEKTVRWLERGDDILRPSDPRLPAGRSS